MPSDLARSSASPRSFAVLVLLASIPLAACASSTPRTVHSALATRAGAEPGYALHAPRETALAGGSAPLAARLAPPQAAATWPLWCLALQGGYTCVDSESGNYSQNDVDEMDWGFGAFAAVRPIRWVSLEVGYQDLGEETYTDRTDPPFVWEGQVETSGFQVCAVGHYPIWGPLEAIARLGVFFYESEDSGENTTPPTFPYSEKDDGTEITYGLGVQSSVWGPVQARLEWSQIEGIDFGNLWLSLIWGF